MNLSTRLRILAAVGSYEKVSDPLPLRARGRAHSRVAASSSPRGLAEAS